jgi:HEAT repeat protein
MLLQLGNFLLLNDVFILVYCRIEGGIPPLVELLESQDLKVQRAAAGALRTLAFKNDENKSQIVDCNALPTLILMLRSEDAAIHYEAVRH